MAIRVDRKKVLGYAIGPIGAAILSLVSLPIITWFYSVEDVGRISMLQVVASLSVLFFCLGLDQAYVREYHETNKKAELFKNTIFPGAVLSLILLYSESSYYLSVVSIVCFVLSLISRFLSLILRMEERALAYSMSQLLPKLFFLCFVLSTVWLGFSANAYNLITAHAFSIVSAFLVFSWTTRKAWLSAIRQKVSWVEQKRLLQFGLPLVLGGLASWGLNVMDKLFLRSMSTFEELGIYSVTVSIAGVAIIFSGVFNTIWFISGKAREMLMLIE